MCVWPCVWHAFSLAVVDELSSSAWRLSDAYCSSRSHDSGISLASCREVVILASRVQRTNRHVRTVSACTLQMSRHNVSPMTVFVAETAMANKRRGCNCIQTGPAKYTGHQIYSCRPTMYYSQNHDIGEIAQFIDSSQVIFQLNRYD